MDRRWRKVWAHIKTRGKFVNVYVEVTNDLGLKIFRSTTLRTHEVKTCRIDLIAFTLNGMVRDIDRQLDGHR